MFDKDDLQTLYDALGKAIDHDGGKPAWAKEDPDKIAAYVALRFKIHAVLFA